MPATLFDRDEMARWYAHEHIKADPGVRSVYYLPTGAPEREIRFIEINEDIGNREDKVLEPIDFGVDLGKENEHMLLVLDVTPDQWDRINQSSLQLPQGWSLEGKTKLDGP
jgi:hypothetical protein